MDQNPQTSAEIVSNLHNFVFLGSRIITDFADANLVIPFLHDYVALFLDRVEPVKPDNNKACRGFASSTHSRQFKGFDFE